VSKRTIRTPKVRDAFLIKLRETCSVEQACQAVGVGRTAMYAWKNADAEFSADWESIFEGVIDQAYGMVLRQARDDEGPVGMEARKVLLRAHKPELFNRGLLLRHELLKLELMRRQQEMNVLTIDGEVVVNGTRPMIYPRRDLERTGIVTMNGTLSAADILPLAIWCDAVLALAERAEEENGDGP
jgi:hypothetical protein